MAQEKVACNDSAQRLRENRASLRREDGDWIFLFADFAQVGTKPAEDFAALAHMRISGHKQAEAQRLEKERERIEAEARAKAEREAQAKAQAELEAERERIRQEEAAKLARDAAAREAAEATASVKAQAEEAAREQLAREAQAKADAPLPAQAQAVEQDAGATVTLGQLNARLTPISITAAGLAELGFEPCATAKAAKLYREADFARICRAIANHALAAMTPAEA